MNAPTPLVFSLKEQIVERLRIDVLCGRLSEGEPLSELRLVEQFGVSRTPIREALQQLTHEGLLEGRPNAGVKVAHRPADSIRELVVPIRRSVEVFALRSFYNNLKEDEIRVWDEILENLKRACEDRDFTRIAEHDIEFHRAIVRRATQRDLDAIWMALVARVRSHFWQTQCCNYDDPIEIYEEHRKIVESFRAGDLEKAVALLEANIN
ncbi:MAG: GntR family transcriptional regulator [Planctomycetota bacterium]|nr:GntR family transcriptional regulator [Planctomycetota bacterium]